MATISSVWSSDRVRQHVRQGLAADEISLAALTFARERGELVFELFVGTRLGTASLRAVVASGMHPFSEAAAEDLLRRVRAWARAEGVLR